MKIYLASSYLRRDEMKTLAPIIQGMGHEVVSRWFREDHADLDNGVHCPTPQDSERFAMADLEDLRQCKLLIQFTEPKGQMSRGGRHVELGFALALGASVWIVGHAEHVFHWLPEVNQYATVLSMLVDLADIARREKEAAAEVSQLI